MGHESAQKRFRCGACGLEYREKRLAEKCEAWCRTHNSCNLEITRHAVSAGKGAK